MNTVNLTTKTPDRYEVREAFKTLRTNILFSGSDVKVITITSSTQNEGKSFVSLELSKSLAEAGKKVLLVDADLRKSVLADKHVDSDDIVGLSHYLSGQANSDDIIYGTQYENFYIAFSVISVYFFHLPMTKRIAILHKKTLAKEGQKQYFSLFFKKNRTQKTLLYNM